MLRNWDWLVEDLINKVIPKKPDCPICRGPSLLSEVHLNEVIWVCSRVKPTNDPGDGRRFDPYHYDASKVRLPNGPDIEILRISLYEAFGRVEGETEKRLKEDFDKQKRELMVISNPPSKEKRARDGTRKKRLLIDARGPLLSDKLVEKKSV